jgi:fatty-acyl-CoA synthase
MCVHYVIVRSIQHARAQLTVARAHARFPERPDRPWRALLALSPWGVSLPGVVAASAARYPGAVAVYDGDGAMTYRDLWAQARGLAGVLRARGFDETSVIGILARNGRQFVEATVAAAALGADVVFLNTSFAPPQLADACASESVDVILHDVEAEDALGGVAVARDPIDALAALGENARPARPPARAARLVILTSGTTGRPKGAVRQGGGTFEATAALLGRIPLRPGDRVVIAAPLFHAWGLTHLLLALSMGSTAIVRPAFDAEATMSDLADHRAHVLVAVPVMSQRIVALGGDVLVNYDTSSLRVIASSGSALPGRLATELLHRFGPVLYNVYGSTEVATATVATPDDLARHPTTAGRPAPGVAVRILDRDGHAVPTGTTGRVFVANAGAFDGYSDGADKERHGALVASGDLGHVDAAGRLFIDGREDDMIVSGGENVYPREVEEVLAGHPDVLDVAVVGVEDDEFGQALAAFVVARPGAEVDVDGIRAFVRERMARFKVPKRVVFLDELPRNATGKVMKAALR